MKFTAYISLMWATSCAVMQPPNGNYSTNGNAILIGGSQVHRKETVFIYMSRREVKIIHKDRQRTFKVKPITRSRYEIILKDINSLAYFKYNKKASMFYIGKTDIDGRLFEPYHIYYGLKEIKN